MTEFENIQLVKSRSKKQNKNENEMWIEKNCFKPGIRLKIRLKNSRNILG